MSEPIIFIEDREPDIVGERGKAWKVDVEAVARRHPGGPDASLTVAHWIVEAQWAHPLWHSYFIGCVSLRDVPGVPAAKINLPGATHEVLVYALNPSCRRMWNEATPYLLPGNFHGQWIAGDDDAARAFIEETVKLVVDGKLNPDTDARSQWIQRFSASNMKIPTELADATLVAKSGDTLVVVGTGKTAMDVIISVAAGPVPPKGDQH